MRHDLSIQDGDAPVLRRLLFRELEPMLHPPGNAPAPRWICIAAGPLDAPSGGLIALTTGAWLSIDLFWLPENLRRRGIGRALLCAAENRAAAIGCVGAYVATTSETTCRFYQRNDYFIGLRLKNIHPGITQVTLQKTFV